MPQDQRKQRTQEFNNTLVNGTDAEKAALMLQHRSDIRTLMWWGLGVTLVVTVAVLLVNRARASHGQNGPKRS